MRHSTIFALGIVIFSLEPRGDVLLYNDNPIAFGHVAQNIGGDIHNGQVACGPTSVYNSFVFLKSEYGIDLTGPSAADTINTLEADMNFDAANGGVVNDIDLANGKVKYIADQGKAGQVSVESLIAYDPNNANTHPNDALPGAQAAQFIYNQLSAGQDVEMAFYWSDANGVKTAGGHWVTVTGIDFDSDLTVLDGTLSIVDPWAAQGDLVAPSITGGLRVVNGRLVFGYAGGAAGDGDALVPGDDQAENPQDSGYGYITGVVAESVTPLPPTVWGGIALIGGLGVYRKLRPRRMTMI